MNTPRDENEQPISREAINASLLDLKQMWAALVSVAATVPSARPVLASRKELPPLIDAIFEQAARSATARLPAEPTEEMLQAALDGDIGTLDTPLRELYRLIYIAMRAADKP